VDEEKKWRVRGRKREGEVGEVWREGGRGEGRDE
jgi:hypothetical protein